MKTLGKHDVIKTCNGKPSVEAKGMNEWASANDPRETPSPDMRTRAREWWVGLTDRDVLELFPTKEMAENHGNENIVHVREVLNDEGEASAEKAGKASVSFEEWRQSVSKHSAAYGNGFTTEASMKYCFEAGWNAAIAHREHADAPAKKSEEELKRPDSERRRIVELGTFRCPRCTGDHWGSSYCTQPFDKWYGHCSTPGCGFIWHRLTQDVKVFQTDEQPTPTETAINCPPMHVKGPEELQAPLRESEPIKPCAFCGSDNLTYDSDGHTWRTRCRMCAALGPVGGSNYECISKWNGRKPTPTETALNSPSASGTPSQDQMLEKIGANPAPSASLPPASPKKAEGNL